MGEDPFELVGTAIDARYRVDEVVGEGGFAVVYRGFHLALEQCIAVKCLKIPGHFTAEARNTFWQRFREEGKLLARLTEHPSIVGALDVGTALGAGGQPVPYLVLEWLEGQDFRQLLDDRPKRGLGPLTESEALALLRPAVDAMAFAHGQGIAHRDLKPANLFVARKAAGTVVKVLDFGIAKAMQEGERVSLLATKTSSGFSAFSPPYGAPEQFRSDLFGPTGPWTDVHALGLVLVELVGGRQAMATAEAAQLYASAVADVRPTPRECGIRVSEPFEQLCAKALALMPKHRFPDARAMLAALDALLVTDARGAGALGATPAPAAPQLAAGGAAAHTADFVAERGYDLPPLAVHAASRREPTVPAAPWLAGAVPGTPPPAETVPAAPWPAETVPGTPRPASAARAAFTVPAGPAAAVTPAEITVPAVLARGATEVGALPAFGHTALPQGPGAPAVGAPKAQPSRRLVLAAALGGGSALALFGLVVGLALSHGDEIPSAEGAGPSGRGPGDGRSGSSPPIVLGPDNMVLVPAGELEMGCPHYAANCPDDEKPAHPVELGAYYIDRTEVTVGQFRRCVQSGGCREPSSGAEDCNWLRSERGDHPINCVNWSEADRYCRWANKRLPTEAEWEKAARGTDGRTYPWGEERPSCELAIMDQGGRGCGRDSTWPVGSRPAGESPYGAHDMVGNVSEWVADGYDPGYYANSPRHDPLAQSVSSPRGNRGGSWRQTGPLRATSRDHWKPELWSIHLGFRCARSAS